MLLESVPVFLGRCCGRDCLKIVLVKLAHFVVNGVVVALRVHVGFHPRFMLKWTCG